jgi:uncharacterized circularly permuted ATP-grasp superfamily protein/uncharacterized alpha-E superfamily protein
VSDQQSLPGVDEIDNYARGTVWDELVTGDGRIRKHWDPVMGYLAQFDPAELGELRDEAARLLRQNGVAYTIYDDPAAADRPWPLDLVPLLISAEEWRVIEAGVMQRARLLNALLADIYGAQRVVADGLLPPSLLHANPSFLRPCCGVVPRQGAFLQLYAVDLARSPDGGWWVLADRSQAPSGAGYALENRSVVGRVLADCLGAAAVEPLAPFFAALRDNLCALAPAAADRFRPPRIVLLTPGIYNETYFEHAYLARRLDVTLVEGADLTVRDRRVFLRTLGGLEPVDVILRRLDDDFCDPLELRAESTLGIAGLVEAARAGNVTIANALGSGILEGMAFKPFLPGLSRALLGETLQLPDVASWWCGGVRERQYVADHIDRLVIKPAFPALGVEPVFGAELSQTERAALLAQIAERPLDFVGQERVELSTVPVHADGKLVPRPLVLRVFAAASGDGFVVMPGGLTRTSPVGGGPIVSMQQGGGCKDTWIVGAAAPGTRAAETESAKIVSLRSGAAERHPAASLPSRAADGLFWTGRYVERVGSGARLLRSLLLGITDAAKLWTMQEIEPALAFATAVGLLPPVDLVGAPPTLSELVALIRTAVADQAHPSSVAANLQRLVAAARGVRDQLPPGCWQIIGDVARKSAIEGSRAVPARVLLRLDEMVAFTAAFWGTVDDMMERDAGWRFLDLGRRLERAVNLVALFRAASRIAQRSGGEPHAGGDEALLAAVLTAVGAHRFLPDAAAGERETASGVSAGLLNASDPLSIAFQLASIAGHLRALPQAEHIASGDPQGVAQSLALTQAAQAVLSGAMGTASRQDGATPLAALDEALAPLTNLLPEISNALTRVYFTHAFARPA